MPSVMCGNTKSFTQIQCGFQALGSVVDPMGPSGGSGSAACRVAATASTAPNSQRELSACNVDHLRGRIFPEAVDVELDTDARTLDAADRRHRMQHPMWIHPGRAALKRGRHCSALGN